MKTVLKRTHVEWAKTSKINRLAKKMSDKRVKTIQKEMNIVTIMNEYFFKLKLSLFDTSCMFICVLVRPTKK